MKQKLRVAILSLLSLLAATASAQPNLQPYQPAGWAYPLVPRGAPDAAWNNAPAPTTLPGNTVSTYWNESCWNAGSSATPSTFLNQLRIDGGVYEWYSWPILSPFSYSTHTNAGPVIVRGGRHTFELRVDCTGLIGESNETDNNFARQWVWTPLVLPAGTAVTREAPPSPTAGWESIPGGQDRFWNCDGLRFATGSGWDVVCVYALSWDDDYDVYLYNPSTGAGNGFANSIGASERGSGGLDGVIASGYLLGYQNFDVGVVGYSLAGGGSNYVAKHIASLPLAFGSTMTGSLVLNEMLRLYGVPIGGADVGPVTATLQMGEGGPSLMLLEFSETFQWGGLPSYSSDGVTDIHGFACLDFVVGSPGDFALAIMRDPVWGAEARTFTLHVGPGLPNPATYTAAGWHSPMVPRPAQDGTPTHVALPDTLIGDEVTPRTWFNICCANLGIGACPRDFDAYVWVDGVRNQGTGIGPLAPGEAAPINLPSPVTIMGGRHTLMFRTNQYNWVIESNPYDNTYAEQYCWSGLVLNFGESVPRGAPPDPNAGSAELGSGEPFYSNCDGFRLPALSGPGGGPWRVAAVMPLGTSDVDIDLHSCLIGTKNGFATPLVTSNWGPQRSDWVMVDYHFQFVPFDIGVRRVTGSDGYVIQTVISPPWFTADHPITLTGSLGAGEILDLVEIVPPAGPLALLLENVSGGADLGLAVYEAGLEPLCKSDGMIANTHGPGGDEGLNLDVPYYSHCIAVYKTGASDLPRVVEYRLLIAPGVSAAPDELPSAEMAVRLGAHPNPFNPRTSFSFALAKAGPARLAIYDIRGRLVRSLVNASLPAGEQSVEWDGTTDQGNAAPSGIYFARLGTAAGTQTVKVTLAK